MLKPLALACLPLLFACTTTAPYSTAAKLRTPYAGAAKSEAATTLPVQTGTMPERFTVNSYPGSGSNQRFVIPKRSRWSISEAYLQGLIGVSQFSTAEVNGGPTDIDGDDGDLDQLPYIGGGGQWKLGGDRIDWGLEAMLGLSGRANTTAFVSGGGGTVIAVDLDLLIVEFFGGPFFNMFIGEKLRVYAAAGPLFQFADYDQEGPTINNDSGTGFGFGGYARAGFEYLLPGNAWLGIGVRWSDTTVDLNDLGDLEMDGILGLITLTRRN